MPLTNITEKAWELVPPQNRQEEYQRDTALALVRELRSSAICKEENICKVGGTYHREYMAKQADQLQQIKQGQKK